MSQKIKDIILFVGILAVILLIVFRGGNETIYVEPKIHDIETRIIEKDTIIYHNEKIVIKEKNNAIETRVLFDSLFLELERVKNSRDTVQIIQIQDTLINTLNVENFHLKNVIVGQDSIIVAQRYIINSKDTIISIGNRDLKQAKRQRNISMLINAGLILFKN